MTRRLSPNRRVVDGRPGRDAIAGAAIAGIVIGALGGGFALGALVLTAVLAAVGVWRVVRVLLVISEQLEQHAAAVRPRRSETDQTMRIR